MIFDIIFIRHGLSCANVLSAKRPGFQLFYQDPELTLEGIYNSKDFSTDLIEYIHEAWGDEGYTVGASQMIRAQETAFHMLASKIDRPIFVFPHIGEKPLSYDNYSLPRDQQRDIMQEKAINKGILEKLIEANDFREPQTISEKSNFPKFIKWLKQWLKSPNNGNTSPKSGTPRAQSNNNATRNAIAKEYRNKEELGGLDISAENAAKYSKISASDEVVRMVIFTHGLFIQSIVKGLNHISNNNALRILYDTGADRIMNKPKIHHINDRKILYECPDGCRKTRCSEKTRNWGSAGRRERQAILTAERAAKSYMNLDTLQKPKTFKNYLKRGYYGVKRLFNGKKFANRVKNAETRRNTLTRRINHGRHFNRMTRKEQAIVEKQESIAKGYSSLKNIEKPKTFKNYMKRAYYGIKRVFNGKSFNKRLKNATNKLWGEEGQKAASLRRGQGGVFRFGRRLARVHPQP
jgi:broad specificity phosphatase PhoE